MAKFKYHERLNTTTLFNDGCNSENYHPKGLRPIDPAASDNIMPLLREKYKHLTDAQHNERILTAIHEAAHLTVALALKTCEVGPFGFIRVPGRSSSNTTNNHRGIAGRVTCGSYDPADEVIICFAGYALSKFITEPEAVRVSADDERQALSGLDEMLQNYRKDSGIVLTSDEKLEFEYHYRSCLA